MVIKLISLSTINMLIINTIFKKGLIFDILITIKLKRIQYEKRNYFNMCINIYT